MTDAPTLRLGMVGAGGFATFLAGAVESLPSVSWHSVTDARPEPALRLAAIE